MRILHLFCGDESKRWRYHPRSITRTGISTIKLTSCTQSTIRMRHNLRNIPLTERRQCRREVFFGSWHRVSRPYVPRDVTSQDLMHYRTSTCEALRRDKCSANFTEPILPGHGISVAAPNPHSHQSPPLS